MVTKADTFITGLEEENRQAEDELQKKEKELKALEHEVYYAQTDIPAGQLISGDMVQKEIVQTEFDDSFFINASDLGSVAASIPIKAGTPLMLSLIHIYGRKNSRWKVSIILPGLRLRF